MRNTVQYSLESYDERREDEFAARKSLSYNLNIVLLRTTYPQNAVQDSEDSIHACLFCFRDRFPEKKKGDIITRDMIYENG